MLSNGSWSEVVGKKAWQKDEAMTVGKYDIRKRSRKSQWILSETRSPAPKLSSGFGWSLLTFTKLLKRAEFRR